MFRPDPMVPLEMLTPPKGMLEEKLYLVNSGFFHPESLMRSFPESRFIGLPLDPDHLEPFLADYPEARTVLWHGFSVQSEIQEAISNRPGTTRIGTEVNEFNRPYTLIQLAD